MDLTKHVNSLSTRINADRLNSLGRDTIARQSHEALNGIQRHRPEDQLMAVALLFAVMAERYDGGPQELYQKGRKVLFKSGDGDTKTDMSLESLRDFAKLRVRNGVVVND